MNDPDEMKRRLLSTSIIIIILFPRVRPSACSQFLLLGFTWGKSRWCRAKEGFGINCVGVLRGHGKGIFE